MTTLTTDQLSDLRGDSGATTADVSDADMQRFYDKALTFGEDEDTTYARTMVYILRRLLGGLRKKIDLGGEIENERQSQLFDHIKDKDGLLAYWEGLAGMSGAGVLTTGVLAMDLDYTEDDLEAGF